MRRPSWPRGGLWRHADFMRLWGAQTISQFGTQGAAGASLGFLPMLLSPLRALKQVPVPAEPALDHA